VARFVVRLDDLCPTMNRDRFERMVELLDRHDVRPLAGIVPENRDPDLRHAAADAGFWAKMRSLRDRGWRFAQHGWTHEGSVVVADELGLSPLTEFAGRSEADQRDRVTRGRRVLEAEGLGTDVFMAPFHSFDAATVRALAGTGFRYVTDGFALFPYTREGLVFVPQLFEYDANIGVGIYTMCLHPNNMDDASFGRLERILDRRRGRVVDFDQIADEVRVGPFTTATRPLLRWGIGAARAARARLRR